MSTWALRHRPCRSAVETWWKTRRRGCPCLLASMTRITCVRTIKERTIGTAKQTATSRWRSTKTLALGVRTATVWRACTSRTFCDQAASTCGLLAGVRKTCDCVRLSSLTTLKFFAHRSHLSYTCSTQRTAIQIWLRCKWRTAGKPSTIILPASDAYISRMRRSLPLSTTFEQQSVSGGAGHVYYRLKVQAMKQILIKKLTFY